MKLFLLGLLLVPLCTKAQILGVCDVLDRLSELNGKEVQIRGAWLTSDAGDWLWATPACAHPTIKDGWVWKDTIRVELEDPHNYERWRPVYVPWSAVRDKMSGHALIIATLTGHLETKDHFKVSRFSNLPQAYGYSPAVLVLTRTEDLEAVPFSSAQELNRFEQEAFAPWPRRVKKTRR